MRRLLVPTALLALVSLTGACADVRDRVDEARDEAEGLSERARFCLSVARAVAAVNAEAPETAADAAEEVLAQAPEDLRDDARVAAEALEAAREGDTSVWDDPELQAAVERLRDETRERCDPTS